MSDEILNLSQDEEEILVEITSIFSQQARMDLTFRTLLNHWIRFVIEVEHVYNMSIYDYENDLTTRDLLEEILTKVPDTLYEKIYPVIQRWDTRFKNATRILSQPLIKGPLEYSWWMYRIPVNPGEELKSDLNQQKIS